MTNCQSQNRRGEGEISILLRGHCKSEAVVEGFGIGAHLPRLLPFAWLTPLLFCLGCERPPVPASTESTGPPAAVYIDPKSDEGKHLLAERKQFHDTFVPEKREPPPDEVQKPAIPTSKVKPEAAPAVPQPKPPAPAAPPQSKPAAPPQSKPPTPPQSKLAAPVPATQPQPQAPAVDGPKPATTPAAAGTSPAPKAAAKEAPPPGSTQQISAEDAARRKGRELGSGPITTPIRAFFSSKEQTKLIEFKSALMVWVTENDRKPHDFAELEAKVIKPAGIKLPELRPGERYIYDAKQGQYGTLLVEQPAPK